MEQQLKATPEFKKVAQWLRGGSAGIKVRVGALHGKRVDYFKGKSAVKALLSPAYSKLKSVPPVTSESEALAVLSNVNAHAFYLRVQRGGPSGSSSSSPKSLQILPEQFFQPNQYYAWFYEGSQWTTYAAGILMVAVLLAGVMFPLWPPAMRVGTWYLSVGMLGLVGLLFAIAILRLITYVITVIVASPGVWIFPQLFADVGLIDSFIPLWEWDLPKKALKKKKAKHVVDTPTEPSTTKEKKSKKSKKSNPSDRQTQDEPPTTQVLSEAIPLAPPKESKNDRNGISRRSPGSSAGAAASVTANKVINENGTIGKILTTTPLLHH